MTTPEQARRVLSEQGRTVTLPDGQHVLRFSMAAIDQIEGKYGTVQDAVEQVNRADGKTKMGPLTDLLCAAATPPVDRAKVTLADLRDVLDVLLKVIEIDLGVEADEAKPAANGNGAPPFDPDQTQLIGPVSTTSPG